MELFVIQWKSLVNSGVNEKPEWMKNNPAKYCAIWWTWEIWRIVWQNSLQVQIKYEFTGWFKWRYTAKCYISEKLHHIETFQFNSISKCKINYFKARSHQGKLMRKQKRSKSYWKRTKKKIQSSKKFFAFMFAFARCERTLSPGLYFHARKFVFNKTKTISKMETKPLVDFIFWLTTCTSRGKLAKSNFCRKNQVIS